jgi:uncharacterized paraquat-inducible protein A
MMLCAEVGTDRPHPPAANKCCPLCGVTMFSCISEDGGRIQQTFSCPRCGCVISSAPRDPSRDPGSIAGINRNL